MTNLERARSLRAELEQAQKTIADKRREALEIADALEEEANALREVAGGRPLTLVASFPPPPPKEARKKGPNRPAPDDSSRGYGRQRARIIAAMPVGKTVRAPEIVKALGIPLATVGAELRDLARRGEIERTGRGLFRRVG